MREQRSPLRAKWRYASDVSPRFQFSSEARGVRYAPGLARSSGLRNERQQSVVNRGDVPGDRALAHRREPLVPQIPRNARKDRVDLRHRGELEMRDGERDGCGIAVRLVSG